MNKNINNIKAKNSSDNKSCRVEFLVMRFGGGL